MPRSTRSATSLERELAAERLVLPGYGHAVQRHPEFNDRLAEFVARSARATPAERCYADSRSRRAASSCSRSRRRMRGFMSFTISSRYTT